MTSKKVIFHIGFGKTGTTSIQRMLFHQRDKLKEQGVFYPEIGINTNAHHHLADYKAKKMGKAVVKLYRQIIDQFMSSDCDRLLLSSEQYCFCKPEYVKQLADVFEGMDCEILFYVRRQEDLIPSTFLQKVKSGNTDQNNGDFDLFLRKNMRSFDFSLRIKPWASSFGDKAIQVRAYGRSKNYDVCTDFLQAIGIDEELSSDNVPRENKSLLPEFLGIIKLMDKQGVSSGFRQDIIKSLLDLSDQFRDASKLSLLSEEVVSRIKAYYEVTNKEFSDKYMSDTDKSYLTT